MTADKDSWKREPFTGGLPIPFQATFSSTELSRLRKGLIPKSMDDKWFIYFESPYLYLHRSWTGKLIYRVELRMVGEGASVVECLSDPETLNRMGTDFQAALVDVVISNLLLGKRKPFPAPDGLMDPKKSILQHNVSGTGYPNTESDAGGPAA
jgi:hypothetical protein